MGIDSGLRLRCGDGDEMREVRGSGLACLNLVSGTRNPKIVAESR